jgi:purine-binding chemotaxis protein CheW
MQDETKIQVKMTQVVVFKVGAETFAANIHSIREIVKVETITPVPNSSSYISGIINIRGKIIPIIDLEAILGIGNKDDPRPYIILIDAPGNEEEIVGMLVTDIQEITSYAESEFKTAPKLIKSKVDAEYISGVILPEDDEDKDDVLLFLNLEAIITKSVQKEIDQVTSTKTNDTIAKEEPIQ